MKSIKILMSGLIVILLIFSCAAETPKYDLPSAESAKKPEWVGPGNTVRDTVFIVIHLPKAGEVDLDQCIQKAQSELHSILVTEVEIILRDYWEQKQIIHNEETAFKYLSDLPVTLEHIMTHVTIRDAWEQTDEVSILCALDYEEVAEILMSDMNIKDRSFLSYFKRRMDGLAQQHR